MSDKIIIRVAGPAGIGRSTVIATIAKALDAAGLKASIQDRDGDLPIVMQELPERLNTLKDRGVEIEIQDICTFVGTPPQELKA